jgi:hypothetical protein
MILRVRDENGNVQEIPVLKGEKGDKGDAGSVKFIVCPTLPTENIDEKIIYLIPSITTGEQNTYEEYVYIDGVWEKIGGTTVEVDLTDYVKNTDYATTTKGGVVKLAGESYGLGIRYDGSLAVVPASNDLTSSRATNRPITPTTLDYAVKAAMCDGKGAAWTEAEQLAARDRMGITAIIEEFERRVKALEENGVNVPSAEEVSY